MQEMLQKELQTVWQKVLDEEKQRKLQEEELLKLKKLVSENSNVDVDVSNYTPMVSQSWLLLLLSHFMHALVFLCCLFHYLAG